MPRPLELLAPARDADIARQAILHGADAVYIGGPSHGARAAASNDIGSIARVVDFAHLYGARVYVTLNTIIYEDELRQVEQTVRELYQAGVDALIVQDMALLRMSIPPIDLHASTQCDIRTPRKARFLADAGFSQLVLPREMSLEQIRQVRESLPADVVLETFVHGSLCVSYSGDCQASCVAKGRSANRGECAQMCRLPYTLTDASGRVLLSDKHLLSLRDLNRLADLEALAEAGVGSFKIEGRLKDASYVKTTVAAYRRALDRVIEANPGKYCRASEGETAVRFEADVEDVFNRGFTPYFLGGTPRPTAAPVSMANLDTPKWVGREVGVVKRCTPQAITASLHTELHNGDGLGYYGPDGSLKGFRLNRVDGDRLYPATPVSVPPGAALYRNRDAALDALMAQDTAQRLIDVDMVLDHREGVLSLTLSDARASVTVTQTAQTDAAQTPQRQARRQALTKLGGTPYRLASYTDRLPDDVFVRASALSALRRQAVARLTEAVTAGHTRRERRPEDRQAALPCTRLTYHDNVANSLAREFYTDHGAVSIEPALETQPRRGAGEGLAVMTTRYCLRRQLGACLRTPQGANLPSPLYIHNDSARYLLDFDCANCQMTVRTAERTRNTL